MAAVTSQTIKCSSGPFKQLPEEVVALVLLKSRGKIADLAATALTCRQFHQLSEPVFSAYSDWHKSSVHRSVTPKQVVKAFVNVQHWQDRRLLASVALENALVRLNPVAPSDHTLGRALQALAKRGRPDGPLKLEVCVDIAPQESLELALVIKWSQACEASKGCETLRAAVASALLTRQDEQVCCDLMVVLADLSVAAPHWQTLEAAIAQLKGFDESKPQLDAVCALAEVVVGSASQNASAWLMEIVAQRIGDGSLFQHAMQDGIMSVALGGLLKHLPGPKQVSWLESALTPGLCLAVQQYRTEAICLNTPWPLVLLTSFYARPEADFPREELADRLRQALRSGDWEFVRNQGFDALDQQLRIAAQPWECLSTWFETWEGNDGEKCSIC